MIVISMLLVVVGFVSLMLGVLNVGIGDVEPLTFVYAAIAACLLAGLFLIAGVVRSRPRQTPVGTPAGDAAQASWSGAARRQPERPSSHVEGEAPDARAEAGAGGPAAPEAPAAAAEHPRPAAAAEHPRSTAAAEDAGAPATEDAGAPASVDVEARLRAVPGVGPAKQRALLEHFGTAAAVASASVEELAAVKGVSLTLAQRIHDSLHG